jgi:multidrug resistance protein, MATE family
MPSSESSQPQLSPFHRRFLQLAIVNVLSNLMVPLAGLADVAFLGHLSEIRHLAGVALATVLFNYIYWTFGFLRMGTTGTTAQAVGRGDDDAVLLTGIRNGILALGLGLIILVLQQPLRSLGFTLLSAAPEVEAAGLTYYNALIWGAPATLLNFVLLGWLLGQEKGGAVLLLSLIGNGVHVILDYLFVVQWGWETRGAGSSTAFSQYLMLLVGMVLIRRDLDWVQIKALSEQILDSIALKSAFMLNGDIFVRTFALVSTFALFTNLSSGLGTVALATNALLLQVVTLAAYFIDGIAFATESFAGIFWGKDDRSQLTALLRFAGGVSFSLGITFALIFARFPMLFNLLTNHLDILSSIHQFVLWLLPVLGFGSIAYLLDGYFLGLTQGRILRRSTLIAALVGFTPAALVAWYYHSNHLLWLALSLFMATRAITLGIRVTETLEHKPQETEVKSSTRN